MKTKISESEEEINALSDGARTLLFLISNYPEGIEANELLEKSQVDKFFTNIYCRTLLAGDLIGIYNKDDKTYYRRL